MEAFPTRAEDFSRDWLQRALDRAGVLDGARITTFATQPIGTGQVGDTVRITLGYDRASPTLPPTIAAKLPSRDEACATSAIFAASARERTRTFTPLEGGGF